MRGREGAGEDWGCPVGGGRLREGVWVREWGVEGVYEGLVAGGGEWRGRG